MTHQTSDGEAAAALLKEQESLLTVTAQASASTVKPVSFPEPKHTASPKLTPELEPLTIPPHSTDSHGFPSPTSSQTSSSGIDGMGTKQRSFQWRELLDPEFYPEITIRRTLFFFVWIVPHIIITTYFAVITPAPLVNGMNMASKVSILFDMAAILVFMSPTFLMLLRYTFLPRFITFEKNIHAHKVAAYTLLFWAATHVGIHYHRYIGQTEAYMKNGKLVPGVPLHVNLFGKTTGWTGHTMMFSLFVVAVAALKPIRKRFFEVFYYIHHLFILIVILLFIHNGNHLTYKYLSGPVALYCVDRLYRNLRSIFGKSPIRAVVQHPSGVVEVQMDKKIKYRPGQYVKLYCPSVSLLQWHPITISSAPEEELLTLHFRLEGGWTRTLAKRLGCDFGADARSSSVQNIISKTPGTDVFKFSKASFSRGHDSTRPNSQALDIPYHPLHHDPTTIPIYSHVGENSSYVSIDMVAKGGSKLARNNQDFADDQMSAAKIAIKEGNAQSESLVASASADIEEGNVVIKMGAELPLVYVDGPYSAPMEHFFEYEIGVLVAAGIGVTPAAAVLRSVYFQWLQNKSAMTTKKVYLFWVYRDIGTLEWFKDLLAALKEEGLDSIVEVCTYYTGRIPESRIPQLTPAEDRFGDQVINTSIGTKSYVGRPDFSDIFESLGARHPGTRIGTFFCGPKPMARKVRREAHKWDGILRKQHKTKLDFHTETFS